ncbi:SGNH/GDSL hydrolase family protein [Nitrospira sp. Nam80]
MANRPNKSLLVLASAAVLTLLIIVGLSIGEVAIRAVHLIRDGIPFFERTSGRVGALKLDPELGWRATEYYEETLTAKTKGGKSYPVHRSQRQYGFRLFGALNSTRPKLLVIGDSYTQATAVSDDKTYAALISELLDMEVFAYGAGGYGTLQQYLILDRYVDEIKPDLILWQYCINDFINNDHELEQASLFNNNGLTRPYWINGTVTYLSPKPAWQELREWINQHSRFLYFIVSRIDRLQATTATTSVESIIEAQGFKHPGFLRALQVTDELMGRVRARVGATPIMAFSCDNASPYSEAFATISAHHGIEYWNDIPDTIDQALKRGEDVQTPDEHWNESGHRLVASTVVKHIQERGVTMARHR